MSSPIVIEVGVNDAKDTKKLKEKYNLPIYGFEPVPYFHSLYEKICKKYDDIYITNAAVDIEDGEKEFNISKIDKNIRAYGCSSLHKFSDNLPIEWTKDRKDFQIEETIKVKTIRLDTFLEYKNFKDEIHYLHCDAQGNDINVLKSLGKYINNVRKGQIEVALQTELYKDVDNTLESAIEFLEQNNFNYELPKEFTYEYNLKFERKE